jgi:NadR type nicotinamide-nucleotide adenylyltransferase
MEEKPNNSKSLKKIAIIGPECTGKTTLSKQLAEYYNTQWVPEYARDYVLNLNRNYTFDDVEEIAKKQLVQIHATYNLSKNFIFFDTELIITKVWFEVVYKKIPFWINSAVKESNFDLYLLCAPDLPWESDIVRENGGEMREKLFQIYKSELEHQNFKYFIIDGTNDFRLRNSISCIESHFTLLGTITH